MSLFWEPTVEQSKEFIARMKNIKRGDLDKCSNLILLITQSICDNKPINYSACISPPLEDKNKSTT